MDFDLLVKNESVILEQLVDNPPATTVARFTEKLELARPKSFVGFGLWAGLVPENLDELDLLIEPQARAEARWRNMRE